MSNDNFIEDYEKSQQDQNTSTAGDAVDLFQHGALSTLQGAAHFVGFDSGSKWLGKWADEQYDTLTPEMKTAMAKSFINSDLSPGAGVKDWRAWLGHASDLLGGMAATMIPGGAAAKGLSLAGKAGAAINIAGKAVSAGEATNVGVNALLNLAAGNGQASLNVKNEIENSSFDELMDSPNFKKYVYENLQSGADNLSALNDARERIAKESSDAVNTDFTLGLVNTFGETLGHQIFGKLIKGSLGKTIKSAVAMGLSSETATESLQNATERYRSNVRINEAKGVEGDNSKGVAAAALEGGLFGGVVGASGGVIGGGIGRYRH